MQDVDIASSDCSRISGWQHAQYEVGPDRKWAGEKRLENKFLGNVIQSSSRVEFCSCSAVLVEELSVELDDALDPVGARGQESGAEVVGSLLLTEP